MAQLNTYLTFNGNCKEAMIFYQACLGGELKFQTIGESPLSDKMPKEMKNCILHATLTTESFVLMGSDMTPETGLTNGNNISIFLNGISEESIRITFDKLSEGSIEKHPLENSFWGTLFGNLTDRFGNNWLLHFSKKQNF